MLLVSVRITGLGGRSTAVTFGGDTRHVHLGRGAPVVLNSRP